MWRINKKRLIIVAVIIFLGGYYLLSFRLKAKDVKEPIPTETMKSIVEQQGYGWKELDITEDGIVTNAVITIENDIEVEYIEFNSGSDANTQFLEEKELLLKDTTVEVVASENMNTYRKFDSMGGPNYVLAVCVDNTLLKSKCKKKNKKILKAFFSKVGY